MWYIQQTKHIIKLDRQADNNEYNIDYKFSTLRLIFYFNKIQFSKGATFNEAAMEYL